MLKQFAKKRSLKKTWNKSLNAAGKFLGRRNPGTLLALSGAVAGVVSLLQAGKSEAATYDWSGTSNANMSGTTANWGGTVPGTLDVARWSAATYTNAPYANANMTIGELLFDAGNTGGVTFGTGASTLTLSGVSAVGIQLNNGSGAVNTGSAKFALGASQSWVNNSASTLTVGGAITNGITTTVTLTVNSAGNTSLTGIISNNSSGTGTLALTKSGSGTLTLSGANTYTGATTLSAGILRATSAGAMGTGGLTVNGGQLQLANNSNTNFGRNVTLGNANTTITIDRATSSSTGVTHTLGTLTLGGNNTLTVQRGSNITGTGIGELIFGGAINPSTKTYTFNVGDYAQLTTTTGMVSGAQTLYLTKTGNGTLVLSGNNGTWDTGRLTLNAGTVDIRNINGMGGPQMPITANAGTLMFSLDSAGNFGAASFTIGGNIDLVSNRLTDGAGVTHTLNGALSMAGSTVTVSAGGHVTSGTQGIILGNATLSGDQTLIVNDNLVGGAMLLTVGAITNGTSTVTFDGTGDSAVTGVIGGGSGGVVKQGAGALTLSGANTFTGGLSITGGTLVASTSASALGGTGTGAVTLGDTSGSSAASLLVGTTGLTFANPITLATNASVGKLTIGTTGTGIATTFSGGVSGSNHLTLASNSTSGITFNTVSINNIGTITNAGSGTGGVTINTVVGTNVSGVTQNSSSSALILSGANNTFTGDINVLKGTLAFAGSGSAGNASISSTPTIYVGDTSGSATATLQWNNNNYTTNNDVIVQGGSSGVKTLTFGTTGVNATIASLTLNDNVSKGQGGILTVSGATDLGGASGRVLNVTGGTLALNGLVSNGGIVKAGTGELDLGGGSNTFLGGLTVNEGTVVSKSTGNAGTLGGNGTGTVWLGSTSAGTNNVTLSFGSSTTFNNPITVQAGNSGTVTINNFASYNPTAAGAITLNKGVILANSNTGSGGTLTVSGAIGGTGGVTVSSSATGAVNISGTNTYSGGLTITKGVVNLTGNQSGATGSIALGLDNVSTNTLNVGSASQTAAATVVVGSGKSIQMGNAAAVSANAAQTANVAGASAFHTTVTNNGSLLVGRNATLNVNAYGDWTQNGDMNIQQAGGYPAALVVAANGTFTYAGATPIDLTVQTGGSGNSSLGIAGTFTTGQGFNLNNNGTASSFVYMTGGTLKLSADVGQLMSTTGTGTAGTLRLGTTGGTINTNGFSTTLGVDITPYSSQAGGLTKAGSGTLTLSGDNTYTGGTKLVQGGTLVANSGTALGAASAFTFGNGSSQGVEGTLQFDVAPSNLYGIGFGTLYANSGTLQINYANAAATFGAMTLSQQNTLNITAGAGATGSTPSVTFAATGNTFGAYNNSTSSTIAPVGVDVSLGDMATVAATGAFASTLILGGTSTGNEITGVISDSGSGSTLNKAIVTKSNSGAWTLSGANTFTGNVTVNAGTLTLANSSALGTGSKTFTMQGTSRVLQLSNNITLGNNISYYVSTNTYDGGGINNLDGTNEIQGQINISTGNAALNIASGAGTLTISGNVTATSTGRSLYLGGASMNANTISGIISDGSTAGLPVIKQGTGTWVLSGANSYTGATTINGGKLVINGNQSAATGAVTVATTATLGGTGTIGGAVTVQSGGHLAPGNSPGALVINNTLTLDSGSISDFEIASTSSYDQVTGLTGLTYGGTLNVTGSIASAAHTYTLFSLSSGTPSGDFSSVNLAAAPTGYRWHDFDAGAGVDYFNNASGAIQLEAINNATVKLGLVANALSGSLRSDTTDTNDENGNNAVGSIHVTGSNGRFVSEIDGLTNEAGVHDFADGYVQVDNDLSPAPTLVMLWLKDNDGVGGIAKSDVIDYLAANAGGAYAVLTSSDEAWQKLAGAYSGFDTIIDFGSVMGTGDAFSWKFEGDYAAITVDKVAVVPEPGSLGLLGLGALALMGSRRRKQKRTGGETALERFYGRRPVLN